VQPQPYSWWFSRPFLSSFYAVSCFCHPPHSSPFLSQSAFTLRPFFSPAQDRRADSPPLPCSVIRDRVDVLQAFPSAFSCRLPFPFHFYRLSKDATRPQVVRPDSVPWPWSSGKGFFLRFLFIGIQNLGRFFSNLWSIRRFLWDLLVIFPDFFRN